MRLDPPLDPTSPEARTWLEDELSKAIYLDDRSLLERLRDWLSDLLSSTGSGSLPAWLIAVAIGIGPDRAHREGALDPGELLDHHERAIVVAAGLDGDP